MGLTDEQKAVRAQAIGASEVAAVVELSPWTTPIDLWLRKTGRAEDHDDERGNVGHDLEASMRAIYTRRTGHVVIAPHATYLHPEHPRIAASPDGLVFKPEAPWELSHGLEIKVVGHRVVHHWEDGVPDYVAMQCKQNMAVTGAPKWDVIALLGGPEAEVFTVERDPDEEADLIEVAEWFWSEYIEKDQPPPAKGTAEARRHLALRFPFAEKTPAVPSDIEAEGLLRALALATTTAKEWEARREDVTTALVQWLGDRYAVEGRDGKLIAPRVRGRADYKALAESLYGGPIPDAIVDKYRGERFISPRFYPTKEKTK